MSGFEYVSEIMLKDSRVSESMVFGSPCLAVGPKAFAVHYKENLVVRLPAERARELINSHEGLKFDPLESGWALEGWVMIQPDYGRHERLWVSFAEEARDYAVATVGPGDAPAPAAEPEPEPPPEPDPEPVPGPALERETEPEPAAVAMADPALADRSISVELSLDEAEELVAMAPGADVADERVRSALHKLEASLQSRRATSALRDQLAESGLDTTHMSDDEVVALGRRISQTSVDAVDPAASPPV